MVEILRSCRLAVNSINHNAVSLFDYQPAAALIIGHRSTSNLGLNFSLHLTKIPILRLRLETHKTNPHRSNMKWG